MKSALPFDWRDALVRVDEVLSAPPAIDRIQRPVLRGTLVKRFVLPLELCKPLNQLSRAGTASAGWALGKPSATPLTVPSLMNKWCVRECERSDTFWSHEEVIVPDLEQPKPNMYGREVKW